MPAKCFPHIGVQYEFQRVTQTKPSCHQKPSGAGGLNDLGIYLCMLNLRNYVLGNPCG